MLMVPSFPVKYGQEGKDQIQKVASMLIAHRKDVSLGQYGEPHDCVSSRCGPYTCEFNIQNLHQAMCNPCVYVCRMGQIHVCTPDQCTHYIGTHEGACPLTRLYHGHTRGDTGFIPVDKRTWRFKHNDTKPLPIGKNSGKEHGFADPPPLVVEFRRRLADESQKQNPLQAQKKKRQEEAAVAVATPQTFDLATFDPFTLLKQQRTPLSVSPGSVREDPERQKQQVPGASAAAAAAAAPLKEKGKKKGKQLTAAAAAAEKKKKKRDGPIKKRKLNKDLLKSEAEVARLLEIAGNTVTTLLYSDKRKLFNNRKREILEGQRDQEVAAYYQARGSLIPIAVEVVTIIAKYERYPPYLAILRRDNDLIRYYAEVALETWRVIVNSPWAEKNPGANFENHAMTILYVIRRGLAVNGAQVIQPDEYMQHLPNRNDLPYFGDRFVPSVVTNGIKHIRSAYESAFFEGKRPIDALVLRVPAPRLQ